MTPSSVPSDKRIVFLALPHPASRRTFDFLRTVLASAADSIQCQLITGTDCEPQTGQTCIYLRPKTVGVLDLVAAINPMPASAHRSAYALAASLDHRWRYHHQLVLEELLDQPAKCLRQICRLINIPLEERLFAAADEHIATLRAEMARYAHPLAFLTLLETSAAGAEQPSDSAQRASSSVAGPRTTLIIAGDNVPPSDGFPFLNDGVAVTKMPFDETLSGSLQAVCQPQDHIVLRHIYGQSGNSALLDWVLPRLADGGQLSGQERSEAAAENVMAQLVRSNGLRGLTFTLSGSEWRATSCLLRV